jgi:nicotinamidase/pyrazinamidase
MATKGSFESRAIVVVDPQPDFFEGGTLPVVGATRTSERIATFLRDNGDDYSLKVVTQDWHVDPGDHWSESPDYIVAWPAHCAADSRGAQIHESLANVTWDDVIRKGQHEAAYSGFDGLSEQ